MVNNHSMLINPRTCQKRIFTAGSEVLEATAVGDASISTKYGDVLLQNVLYVRNLNVNLLSTNSLTDEGARVILDNTGGQIHLADGTLFKISKSDECGLLEFQGETWQEAAMTTSTQPFEGVDERFKLTEKKPRTSTKQLWHEHLGHPGQDKA
ncbi:related to retrotransposon protein [Ustilago bromivora]|uniref:Related to retrotransposon protein n=1 Tax=Ustilago bromivora TaxID=307758 RepID=A0A1K0FWS2_9BASI|nr:related to retrotransposon protein [Ustilago bromivora]